MTWLFWFSVAGISYSYFIYPLVLLLLPKRKPVRDVWDEADLPSVSLIIAAHNEAARIEAKIRNSLQLDYPRDRLEILVASDASTDGTDAMANRFVAQGVRLVRASERHGKEYAQGLAVAAAKGDILVFSDAGTEIPADAVRKMVAGFADRRVGAVSSEDRFISQDGRVVGEGMYVRYEMWLRRLESQVYSIVGLSGSFFAVRAAVYNNQHAYEAKLLNGQQLDQPSGHMPSSWSTTVDSDFNSALQCVKHGYVAISDPQVVGIYRDIKDPKREYQRKVRTVIRGVTGLASRVEVLNLFQYGFFAFQVWSHKVMRWAVPWFMGVLLISNIALISGGPAYIIAFVLQSVGYVLALTGWLSSRAQGSMLVRTAYFFVLANWAVAHATVAYLCGTRVQVWTPSVRS